MSNKKKAPAEGDRIDIGGKLPQFDAFAWFVYRELIADNLHWVRIADPEALTLDDIQYATRTEVHAYQMKWSNQANAPTFTFSELMKLLPELIAGWQKLKVNHARESKKITVHLLTNRPISYHDSITLSSVKIGSFSDFYQEVWKHFKTSSPVSLKWRRKIIEIIHELNVDQNEFLEFAHSLEIQIGFQIPDFSSSEPSRTRQKEDVQKLSRFIIDEIADKKKKVHYDYRNLINKLGWSNRFKTIFQHDLIVDKLRYQPIRKTITELSERVDQKSNGYIFLLGGPGTGKSTLITQWAKGRKERVVRYYAFDFTNPASSENYHPRGESQSLFYDLVVQLKTVGSYSKDVLPFQDLTYLRSTFFSQLEQLSSEYRNYGTKTIITIDGLDHVPREYRSATKSFLHDLPAPDSVPEGVLIILGSQSYELDDLATDVKIAARNDENKIEIAPLDKNAVFGYLGSSEISFELPSPIKEKIYEVSQGHPLYLSYLVGKIKSSKDVQAVVDGFIPFDGDIHKYYQKIWARISQKNDLITFLGLIARIDGNIDPAFVKEWNYESVYSDFRSQASHLLDKSTDRWAFFHNSFRQFLIQNTANDQLTQTYDKNKDIHYHRTLATYYQQSKTEPVWKRLFHLYIVAEFELSSDSTSKQALTDFLNESTPENFQEQLIGYRLPEEIRRDIRLGIRLSRAKNDIYLLIRYLFCATELETRLYNLDPATYTKELLALGKSREAKEYLRKGNLLHCSKEYALEASRLFYANQDKVEANILFSLAEPEEISEQGITLSDRQSAEKTIEVLEEWTKTAALFYPVLSLVEKIRSISVEVDKNFLPIDFSIDEYQIRLLHALASTLIDFNRWNDLEIVVDLFSVDNEAERNYLFHLLHEAVEASLDSENQDRANYWLSTLLRKFPKNLIERGKVYTADLIYRVIKDKILTEKWIEGVEQPSVMDWRDMGYQSSLRPFLLRIKLNKLLNLLDRGVPITEAVSDPKGNDRRIIVEFERMLCLTTQILADGIQGKPTYGSITIRVRPIIHFYYQDISSRDDYWYRLVAMKSEYIRFLIHSISKISLAAVTELGSYLCNEFRKHSSYWPSQVRREVIIALVECGYNTTQAKSELEALEDFMLEDRDISGRIEECVSHVSAWIKIQEKEKAEYWINRSIEESIGIGYSKDHQFGTWVQWLRRVNKIQPELAEDRILWFLSQLNHIKVITDGGAYLSATEELLETTFQWQFSRGVEQMQWQLEKGLIHFEDAIDIFIQYAIRVAQSESVFALVVRIFKDLLIPFAKTSRAYVFRKLLDRGYSMTGQRFLKNELIYLMNGINIWGLEEKRQSYYEVVVDFLNHHQISSDTIDINFKPSGGSKQETSSSSNDLALKGEERRLPETTILETVNDLSALLQLLAKEDKANSYFNWTVVLYKILPTVDENGIKLLSNQSMGRRATEYFARLSHRASDLGNYSLSKELAQKAIAESSAFGWNARYDGGTRLIAYNALKKIDSKLGSDQALAHLYDDILKDEYPSSYVSVLDEILPVVTDTYDLEKVWQEIERYLKRLFSNSQPIEKLPNFSQGESSEKQTIIYFLLYLARSPVGIIKQNARTILAEQIVVLEEKVDSIFRSLMKGSYRDKELLMHLLLLANTRYGAQSLRAYEEELHRMAESDNFFLRDSALKLSKTINPNFEMPSTNVPPTPALYSLHLEPQQAIYNEDRYIPSDFVKDTDDPNILIRPFDFWVKILADETGVPIANLAYRLMEIVNDFDDREKLSSVYEKSVRANLDEIGLQGYGYPRPRVMVIQRGLMLLVAELIDLKKIDKSSVPSIFKLSDPSTEFIPEIEKPDFVQSLKKPDGHSHVGENWVSDVEKCTKLQKGIFIYEEGWHVIAEYSLVKSLNWGLPNEIYMSQLTTEKIDQKEYHYIFASCFHVQTDEYWKAIDIASESAIIIMNDHRFTRFDIKSHWLAMNPTLAYDLGWVPDESSTFGWRSATGSQMAQSIFWRNGNVEMGPPHLYSESGEGWFVVVSDEALVQVREFYQDLVIEKKVQREQYTEGQRNASEYVTTLPLNI